MVNSLAMAPSSMGTTAMVPIVRSLVMVYSERMETPRLLSTPALTASVEPKVRKRLRWSMPAAWKVSSTNRWSGLSGSWQMNGSLARDEDVHHLHRSWRRLQVRVAGLAQYLRRVGVHGDNPVAFRLEKAGHSVAVARGVRRTTDYGDGSTGAQDGKDVFVPCEGSVGHKGLEDEVVVGPGRHQLGELLGGRALVPARNGKHGQLPGDGPFLDGDHGDGSHRPFLGDGV